ncbi:MAG: DUF3306 domain-containing protein [Candidatus Thiodiazotropha sp. (ex Troendleina suluensis)]|nr:DUF3306 domain-containing protein [Candidatus Thiodiazotropha sp. (ex Troendleina suluensis)]MCU7945686.1 DUF3306 domain-containing protein [Candidatus Thiodiazotropha sp. (ex Cardiolucina cf. quadrata)]
MKSDDPTNQQIPNQDNFYHRWSERKQASRLPVEEEVEPDEEPQLTDADMPPLESLGEGSDYSGFLSPKVSEQLRQLALQKLFHSAAFNVCDGLDDYAEDFTSFEKLGEVMTADLRHRIEQEARKRQESEDEADNAQLADAESDQTHDTQLADDTVQPETDELNDGETEHHNEVKS